MTINNYIGGRIFENQKTGEKIRFDYGDPSKLGHLAEDHYHRYNPNATGRHNMYLDYKGNPAPKNSQDTRLYPPEGVSWEKKSEEINQE
jgi:hypothetical protein